MMPITPAQLLGFLASSEAFSKLDFVQSQVGLHWIWSSCAGAGVRLPRTGTRWVWPCGRKVTWGW